MNYKVVTPENYKKIPLPYFTEWVAELKSGSYQQCKTELHNGEGYCCLGILSKIQGRLTYKDANWSDLDSFDGYLALDNPNAKIFSNRGDLPKGVTVRCGKDIYNSLARLNDKSDLNFFEIAEIVEQLYDA